MLLRKMKCSLKRFNWLSKFLDRNSDNQLNLNNMKILILANTPSNIERIKNSIQSIDAYSCPGYKIDDLSKHEVHEVSDLISITHQEYYSENSGRPTFSLITDNPSNKVDQSEYDLVVIYSRFVENWRDHYRGGASMFMNPPIAIVMPTKTRISYGN